MERKLTIGTDKYTSVFAVDERGAGNANHEYDIRFDKDNNGYISTQKIMFQKGPIQENGVNGIHNEDLISIVIDRLQGFQSGNYSCRENAIAITKLEESLLWLRKRTMDREVRGVEGKSII